MAFVSLEDDICIDLNEAVSTLPVSFKMIVKATKNDETLQSIIQCINTGWPENNGNIHSLIVPYFNRKESLATTNGCVMFNNRIVIPNPYHQKILKQLHRGHISSERCKSARSYVYWSCMDKQIEDFIKKCHNCQQAAKKPVKTNLCSWPITTRPLERIHIDYAGPLKNKYYLVIIDSFYKYPAIYETPIITSFATNWCRERAIEHTRTVRFHPSSND